MMTAAHRDAERGFTLVEMLVALVIFALLAGAGVGLLRSSVDLQDMVGRKLGDASEVERLHSLFAGDIGQAIARPEVGVGAARRASFEGSTSEMRFIRAGWSNLDAQPRSALQQVVWKLGSGGLVRIGSAQLDGSEVGNPATLARSATAVSMRYRRADGRWVPAFVSDQNELLPAAVEMTVTSRGKPPLTLIAALPPRGLEPKPAAPVVPGLTP